MRWGRSAPFQRPAEHGRAKQTRRAVPDPPDCHVAAEMSISRVCARKWDNRWRRFGEAGLARGSHSDPLCHTFA
ncbi:hypothetical protein HEP86_36565 [Streptomyces sp. RPA4-5]|nr:hypothetical protein HEP86_36565 [Streptomyces sp. RPA4-5]